MQYDNHKKASAILKEIDKNPSNYLVIHYSCESFYDIIDGHTPRITSIAVYSYSTGQTECFSIHKVAEKKHIAFAEIEERYDELEKEMLDEFFQFVNTHQNMKWLHWNMRNINYGFKAIEHRYSVLNGIPHIIEDSHKIDLSKLFIQYYGDNYIENPRMRKLMELNHIMPKGFLNGAEEAQAFSNKEYIKLHQSSLCKVDVLATFLSKASNKTLKVNSKWYEIYGLAPQTIYDYFFGKWWFQIIVAIISMILGALIGKLFK